MLRFNLVTVTSDAGLKRDVKRLSTATGSNPIFVSDPTHVDLETGEQLPDLLVCDVRAGATPPPPSMLAKLPERTKLLYITSEHELASVIEHLQHPKSAGFVCRDDRFDEEEFIITATKLLRGEVFGLAKYLPWGVTSYSLTLKTYDEKLLAIDVINEYCRLAGCRGPVRERIQLVADELMMNALYHAPIDEGGQSRYRNVPRKDMTALEVPPIQVQYACNGRYFAIAVKDSFGSLTRETIMKYLSRAAQADAQDIERKAGGAGLGLLTVLKSVSKLVFNLSPRNATEVVALFDMELFAKGKMGARSLNLFVAPPRPAAATQAVAAVSMPGGQEAAPQASSQRWVAGLGVAAAAALVLLAGTLIFKKRGEAEARQPSKLMVQSAPEQATVMLDDQEKGMTPVEISTANVTPGLHRETVKKAGFRDYTIEVDLGQAVGNVMVRAPLLSEK